MDTLEAQLVDQFCTDMDRKNLIGEKDGQIQPKSGSYMVAKYVGVLAIRISAYVFTANWLQELFSDEICDRELLPLRFPVFQEEELTNYSESWFLFL